MKIEYETKPADVDAWHQQYLSLPGVKGDLLKQNLFTALYTGLTVGVIAFATSRNILGAAIIGVILFLVIAALGTSALRHEISKAARKLLAPDPTNPALGHHTLEVTPECVTETSSHHTVSVQWPGVASAIRTDDHLFIILRSSDAIIVPIRSFISGADRETFIQQVLKFATSNPSTPNDHNA